MRKHLRYISYLLRHKWFVFVAGLRTGAPLWRLLIHDWSKFLPCEWLPYARYFYGSYPPWDRAKIECPGYPYRLTKEGMAESFDRAWLHHQHFNPHHWQYWILREDSGAVKRLPMPEKFAREMLADWMGAGRAITGKWGTTHWYLRNHGHIALHSDTRDFIEKLLADVEGTRELIQPLAGEE